MRNIIKIGLAATFVTSLAIGTNAYAEEVIRPQQEDTRATVFYNTEYRNTQLTQEKDETTNISNISIEGNKLYLTVRVNEKNIDVSGTLSKSVSKIVPNDNWLGTNVSVSDEGYEVINFRIEKNTDSITLLKGNLDLRGTDTVMLGLRNKASNVIYYWQESLQNLDSVILSNASIITDEQSHDLEMSYLTFGDSENTAKSISKDQYSQTTSTMQAQISSKESRGSIVSAVPDTFFKTGTMNKWNTVEKPEYSYGAYKLYFAGTENVQNFFMFLDTPLLADWNTHQFNYGVTLYYSGNVLYNAYDGKLYEDDDYGKNSIEELVSTTSFNDSDGFIIKKVIAAKTSGNFLDKILSSIWGLAPYGTSAVQDWVAPSSSWIPEDISTQGMKIYQPTASLQEEVYGGTIKSQKNAAPTKSLSEVSDHLIVAYWGASSSSSSTCNRAFYWTYG